jgi:glycerol-3-phosphate acyltransferase PlsY
MAMIALSLLLIVYFLGSIPFGLIVSILGYGRDIRLEGSKNIGMTNVWRVLGFWPGLLTLCGDMGKGILAIWLMSLHDPSFCSLFLASLMVVLGHCYSIFLQFSGGKGVATAGGVLFALEGTLFMSVAVIWILVRTISGKSSLSALASAMALVPLSYLIIPEHLPTSLMMVLIIFWRHKSNISRLRKGGE